MFYGNNNNIIFHGDEDKIEQEFYECFVVLQGTPGDGMQNTIDVLPELSSQLSTSTPSKTINASSSNKNVIGKTLQKTDKRNATPSPVSVACRRDFQDLERFLPSHLFGKEYVFSKFCGSLVHPS